MKPTDTGIRLSASDLANHLACAHLTSLDKAAANGAIKSPMWRDPRLAVLQERGLEHENAYLAHLEAHGKTITRIETDNTGGDAAERTRAAMREGHDVIVQAVLASGRWHGRADVLLRVEALSDLGAWSYEVVDTKLSQETRAGTVLQLCLYSEMVAEVQGRVPEYMHVVTPESDFERESFRTHDFLAYHRLVKHRLLAFVDGPEAGAATYPEPTPHCDVCRWWRDCDRRRHDDDHLSLVANISRSQTRELQARDVGTLAKLAELAVPLAWKPSRGSREGYQKAREQARVQLEGRTQAKPVHELLPLEPERGLARLPTPSPGDIFLDLEGDPFVAHGGLEYLFGFVVTDAGGEPVYDCRWALDREQEKKAFEWFVDFVMERWAVDSSLHIYHFAPYEPGAMKRLMGRYGTRGDEIDRMLRAGLFVDLFSITRQAVRASVESYSIKKLEAFYGFNRGVPLEQATEHLRGIERALELGQAAELAEEAKGTIEGYNRDDCVSALELRTWLETLRADLETASGTPIERPAVAAGEPSEAIDELQRRTEELKAALLAGVPADAAVRTPAQHAQWILAHLLEFHRREAKAGWWEYFRLRELSDHELVDEKGAIAGLKFEERVGGTDKSPVDRYSYPSQDTTVREGDLLHMTDGLEAVEIGSVTASEPRNLTIDIKKRGACKDLHPSAVFAHSEIGRKEHAAALLRLGQWVLDHGIDADGSYRAARDLLLRLAPRLSSGDLISDGEDVLSSARRVATALDHGVLPVQGPPGAGKTFTGARMICELVAAGKTVGITAVSHKVIRNLLEAVVKAAKERSLDVKCVHKVGDQSTTPDSDIVEIKDNKKVQTHLASGKANVGGGTSWLWAREDSSDIVDVLFVDEAGQMSLADVLAVSQAAKSLVLLGDPQQLEQPQQGSHPEGTELSALQYILGDQKTIPATHGLFLGETYRLHPRICAFTSELFYEGRLHSRPGLEKQALDATGMFAGAGLWFVPVEHEGNQSSSPEEVESVRGIVSELTNGSVSWIDRDGTRRPLTLSDVLIVAPYNAQVSEIARAIPGARVGTVDKFQGQEAPVVIYSMATSSPEDAPRGMEFLYSLNRFNVATSRAQAVCILVASPRLFEPDCRTPQQMKLANAFCRYLEMSSTATVP